MATDRATGADVGPRVSTRIPLSRSWTSHHRMPDGRIISVDHHWMSRYDWERSPLASDDSWSLEPFGPFVLAWRPLG
jgi:hypothetical protein